MKDFSKHQEVQGHTTDTKEANYLDDKQANSLILRLILFVI